MRRARLTLLGVLACVGLPVTAAAQMLSGSIEIIPTRLARTTTSSRVLAGSILGGHGRIGFGIVEIEGRYSEGSLSPAEGTTGSAEDLVEGSAVVWLKLRPWIAVGAGPQLRAFISASGASHWMRADIRARTTSDLIPGRATAYLEGWVSVGASSNVQGGASGAHGAEAGLSVRIPRVPASARLGYIADRASFANGGTEFIEGIRLSLQVGPF